MTTKLSMAGVSRGAVRGTRGRLVRLLCALVLACPVASFAGDPLRGAEVYRMHCLNCHGADGAGNWPGAPNFVRREGLLQPDALLLERMRNGTVAMPAYRGVLSDRDILNSIAYVRTLMR